MQIAQRVDWWLIDRITGPTCHYLGLRFSQPGDRSALSRDDAVAADVRRGLARANAVLGTAYTVLDIETDPRDHYSSKVYEALAYQLTIHVASKADAGGSTITP